MFVMWPRLTLKEAPRFQFICSLVEDDLDEEGLDEDDDDELAEEEGVCILSGEGVYLVRTGYVSCTNNCSY